MPPKNVREYIARLENKLEMYRAFAAEFDKLQEALSHAMQFDLEQGSAWLNEEASAKFTKDYPETRKVLGLIADLYTPEEGE